VGNEQRQSLLLVVGPRTKPLRERDMENSRASRVCESDRDEEGGAVALSSCESAVLGWSFPRARQACLLA